ncbi:MAG: hypothetical protein C0591_03080 [Marinilabiliales bacterium]|nr:MAG: hypothetical protein C0591_03080 [Marinilabiliales bacterium]
MKNKLNIIKNEAIIDYWKNGESAQMLYDGANNWYQLLRLNKKNDTKWVVSPAKRTTTNCPIIVKGIMAFVLRNYGRSEKEIFDEYYSRCLLEYKQIETIKPGSSLRDLDKEFYALHINNENDNIKFSEKLNTYLNEKEMAEINGYAKSYLEYIESIHGLKKSHSAEAGLSVSDWSIVFYYLYSAGEIEGVKIKEIEKFIDTNNITNPKGKRTTTNSLKKEENITRNRINGKLNKYGETNWSDKYPPLPPDRIKNILPYIKANKTALQTAQDDIDRLKFEIEQHRESHH